MWNEFQNAMDQVQATLDTILDDVRRMKCALENSVETYSSLHYLLSAEVVARQESQKTHVHIDTKSINHVRERSSRATDKVLSTMRRQVSKQWKRSENHAIIENIDQEFSAEEWNLQNRLEKISHVPKFVRQGMGIFPSPQDQGGQGGPRASRTNDAVDVVFAAYRNLISILLVNTARNAKKTTKLPTETLCYIAGIEPMTGISSMQPSESKAIPFLAKQCEEKKSEE